MDDELDWPFRSPDVRVRPEVLFIGDDDQTGPKAMSAQAVATVKVRVRKPYRVIQNGHVHVGGDELTVGKGSPWISRGWVEPVPDTKPTATPRKRSKR